MQLANKSSSFTYCIIHVNLQSFLLCVLGVKMAKNHSKNILRRTIIFWLKLIDIPITCKYNVQDMCVCAIM